MITLSGILDNKKDDNYCTIRFWDPDTSQECDFFVSSDHVPNNINSGDEIWLGTDTTTGDIVIRKKMY